LLASIALAERPVIGDSIAVVVEIVADLVGRQNAADAGPPLCVGADLLAGLRSGLALANCVAAEAVFADHASAQDPVVDRTVAVVVEAVARFRAGADSAHAHRVPSREAGTGVKDALLQSCLACAGGEPAGAGRTFDTLTGDAVVDGTVAVVVVPIADLIRRANRPGAGAPGIVGQAFLRAGLAFPCVGTTGANASRLAGADDVFVRVAVAVVVEIVADLVCGPSGTVAGTPCPVGLAGLSSSGALPLVGAARLR